MNQDNEFEFRHIMRDILLLLGSPKEVADILDNTQDRPITDVELLLARQYACDLFAQAKHRLAYLHTIKLQTSKGE